MFWFDFSWDIQNFLNQFWWQINFLLLVLLVIVGYLAYKKPAQAAGLVIILLPTYLFRSKVWFLPVTFLELAIWTLFLGWLLKQLIIGSYKSKTINHKLRELRWPILLILLAATTGLFIAPNIVAAAGLWKAYFVEAILFFVILVNTFKTKADREIILWALGVSTLTIAGLAIYQKFTGFGIFEPSWTVPENRRVTSLFTSPNAVGLYLGPIMAMYLGWLVSEISDLKKSVLKLIVLIFSGLAIILTKSVGTALGLGAAVVFLAFFGWNKKWTAGITIVLIITSLAIPFSRNLMLPIISLQDASGQNRLELWELATAQLINIKNFLLGLGIGAFADIQNSTRDPLKLEPLLYPHNIVLNFWTEVGLLGVLAFAWIIIKFFHLGFSKLGEDKWIRLGVMAAMVTILVHGLIDVPYFKNDLSILFWIIISLI